MFSIIWQPDDNLYLARDYTGGAKIGELTWCDSLEGSHETNLYPVVANNKYRTDHITELVNMPWHSYWKYDGLLDSVWVSVTVLDMDNGAPVHEQIISVDFLTQYPIEINAT